MNFGKLVRGIALVVAVGSGLAMAQSDPSMPDIYAAAKAGEMDKAQTMIQQVLVSHPNSAKAHFVRAELYAREGNHVRARESLAEAERIAPGLPFAKPESVAELKTQIAGHQREVNSNSGNRQQYALPASDRSSFPNWILPLALAAGAIALGYVLFRRKVPEPTFPQPAYAGNNNGLSGPQSFGTGNPAPVASGYGQPYPPQESGLGSKIVGGVATGLAVGAGVVAAEAIGRRLMDGHDDPARHINAQSNDDFTPIQTNTDMGGENFGIQDAHWDDGSNSGGGSDWDN